jgi:septum formation protein
VTTVPGTTRLVLASASPARLASLRSAGIPATVVVSGVDESVVEASDPAVLCQVLARLKARAVAGLSDQISADALVLGCDSVLGFDGEILGKPTDAADAIARWKRLRGASGILYTGHCLIDMATGRIAQDVSATTVCFAELTDREIAAYVATGEPLLVAGAFTIDGLGGPFVERIEGDAGTVIGLSLPLLRRLLRSLDVEITDLWAPGSDR